MADGQDFTELVAAVARQLRVEPDVQHTLQRTVDLAAGNFAGRACASVSIVRANRVETQAASDERAVRADELQYELGVGPCLDAIPNQATVRIDDLVTDQRYPAWSRRVVAATGVRSTVSLPMFTAGKAMGALNLYAWEAALFGDRDVIEGELFASQVAIAIESARKEEQLQAAMDTRNVIGQAQGILMERCRITSGQAFDRLSRISQHRNVKLVEVARQLIETGEVPDVGPV